MLPTYTLLGLLMAAGISGQIFDQPMIQLGFDFPDFTGPEAFEEGGFKGIKERMAELTKEQMKPRPGIKTKVKTKHEGNTNTTTIEQKGKGYKSWARLTTFDNGNNKTGEKSFSKMISSIFGGGKAERMAKDKSKKSECSGQKPCKDDSYCDPIDGVCKPRLPNGAACFFKNQCKKDNDAICIWGRCSTGRAGQPGTFCRKDKECIADSFCGEDSQFSIFHAICKPKLSEGASCGGASPMGVFKVLLGKRSVDEEDDRNPCKNGLKCEPVGFLGGMVCVPETLVTKPKKEQGDKNEDKDLKEADQEASSGDQDTEEKEDNNEGGDIVPSKEKKPEEQQPSSQNNDEDDDNKEEQDQPEVKKPSPADNNDGDEETTNTKLNPQDGNKQPSEVNPGKLPKAPAQKKPPQNLPYPPPSKKAKKKKNKKINKNEEEEE